MTKKEKILKMFDEAEWIESLGGKRVKTITYEDFKKAGLKSKIEFKEKYGDAIYARSIFNKMGYKVLVGSAMHIYEK